MTSLRNIYFVDSANSGVDDSKTEYIPSLLEAVAVAALIAIVLLLVAYRLDALPMQLWDESRNANNALEAVRDNHWLAPTYAGRVDHWNTKPPLLIWLIAALMKAGLPPLWALRLPSMAAALATLGAVWAVPRYALKDRAAGLAAAAALAGSTLYFGVHVARTGDYDALESAFVLGYVLCFWRLYQTTARLPWLAACAALVIAAVMTKATAGVLAVPGLAVLAVARWRTTLALLRDWRTWTCFLAIPAICIGYYLVRESIDPGYLHAVAFNDLGGRFNSTLDGHTGSPIFYIEVLLVTGSSILLLLPLSLLPAAAPASPRRDLLLASLGAAGALLLVLSASATKIFWYAAPAVPLLSLAAGIGAMEAIRRLPAMTMRRAAAAGVAAILAISIAGNLEHGLFHASYIMDQHDPRMQYGPFMTRLWRARLTPAATILDSTFWDSRTVDNYEPIDRFYSRLYSRRWPTSISRPGAPPRIGKAVLTCDPEIIQWLGARYALAPMARGRSCLMARVTALRLAAGAE